jgi:hypothetical protein
MKFKILEKQEWIEAIETLGSIEGINTMDRYPLIKCRIYGELLPEEHLKTLGCFTAEVCRIGGIEIKKSVVEYMFKGHSNKHNIYPTLVLKFILININSIVKDLEWEYPEYIKEMEI